MGVAETGWIWSYVQRTAVVQETGPLWHPPADIYSTGDTWWITLALPGVKRSCVQCEVREGALHIRASRDAPWHKSARALLSLEIPYGRFERRFALPHPDARIISAELIDGCLQIELAVPPATARPL